MAACRLEQGSLAATRDACAHALELARLVDDRRTIGNVSLFQACAALGERGPDDEVLSTLAAAAAALGAVRAQVHEASAHGIAGLCLVELHRFAEARSRLAQAAGLARGAGHLPDAARWSACIAGALALDDRLAEAEEAIEQARRGGVGDQPLVRAQEALLWWAAARAALGAGDVSRARTLHREARQSLADPAAAVTGGRFETRYARRIAARAWDALAPPSNVLAVADDGRWLRLPAARARSEVSPLSQRRMLALLARRSPGAPVAIEDLAAAGWPGERPRPEAASNRVHVGVSALRDLGLRPWLAHGQGGLAIVGVPVVLCDPERTLDTR